MMHVFHDHLKLQKESYIRGFLSKRKRKKERETDTHTHEYTHIFIYIPVFVEMCVIAMCVWSLCQTQRSLQLFSCSKGKYKIH